MAQIFISYASEDFNKVKELHKKLNEAGYKTWMDRFDLLAGQRWEPAIKLAISSTDFFLLCLSNNSVKKRGFVQFEIKRALELWQEKLKDDIYLIPVMIEAMDHQAIPTEIREIMWVELYEDDGWEKLTRALKYGLEQRGMAQPSSPPTPPVPPSEVISRFRRQLLDTITSQELSSLQHQIDVFLKNNPASDDADARMLRDQVNSARLWTQNQEVLAEFNSQIPAASTSIRELRQLGQKIDTFLSENSATDNADKRMLQDGFMSEWYSRYSRSRSTFDAQVLRGGVESEIRRLLDQEVAEFRHRLLAATAIQELSHLQHEIDVFLEENPENADGLKLRDQVNSARRWTWKQEVLAEFNSQIPAATSIQWLRRLQHEIEVFLRENLASDDERMLQDSVMSEWYSHYSRSRPTFDVRVLRDSVESKLQGLQDQKVAVFRRRLLAAPTIQELRRLQQEIEAFREENPINAEARQLQGQVKSVIWQLENISTLPAQINLEGIRQNRGRKLIVSALLVLIALSFIWARVHKLNNSSSSISTTPTPSVPPTSLTIFEFETATFNPRSKEFSRSKNQAEHFIENPDGLSLDMVKIPDGAFTMGSPQDEGLRDSDEGPQHLVRVQEFYLGRFEITRAQWQQVAQMQKVKIDLREDPSHFKDSWQQPVEQVSWEEAVEFCERLKRKTGREYRLPTEAEWEYAARARTVTPYAFGATITPQIANYNYTYPYVPGVDYHGKTVDVGGLGLANDFGLSDMHGNVWEWCEDKWHDSYEGAPSDGSAWIAVVKPDKRRVLRGGSWDSYMRNCRSALRFGYEAGSRSLNMGFRVVCGQTQDTR